MNTSEIIYLTVLYLFTGLATYALVWKGIEKDSDIRKKPRRRRICIRVAAILIWPLIWVACIYVVVKYILGWLWESLTE